MPSRRHLTTLADQCSDDGIWVWGRALATFASRLRTAFQGNWILRALRWERVASCSQAVEVE